MGPPPIAALRSAPGDPMVRKKTISELEQAEIKLESLLERRTALNQEAALLREERDLVHEKKRELTPKLRVMKDRRADLGAELRATKRRVSQMEMRQQTASLTLTKENVLLDEIKRSMKRLRELESLKADQDKIAKEVRDIDAGITERFQAAEKEHEAAVALSAEARAVHEDSLGLVREISALVLEGDGKHEAYLAARDKADEIHAKVVEMRDKVLSIRGAKRTEARESRDLLRAQNRQARALSDPKKLEDSADRALRALLEKGRVEIGR